MADSPRPSTLSLQKPFHLPYFLSDFFARKPPFLKETLHFITTCGSFKHEKDSGKKKAKPTETLTEKLKKLEG